jgi:hypothetical protein
MNRGGRREAIFKDQADREQFLDTPGEACRKTGGENSRLKNSLFPAERNLRDG